MSKRGRTGARYAKSDPRMLAEARRVIAHTRVSFCQLFEL